MNGTSTSIPWTGLASSVSSVPTSILVASAVPLAFLLLSAFISPSFDPQEPPVVRPWIPLIGHILGLVQHGFVYLRRPASRSSAPIITLPMLNGRMYLATGREVISQIARNSKTLSFDPFVAPMAAKVTGCTDEALKAVEKNLLKEDGEVAYYHNISRRMKHELAPGQTLVRMEKDIYRHFAAALNELQTQARDGGRRVGLFDFLRRVFYKGTFTTLYGESHPYNHDPSWADDIMAYENGIDGLLLGFWPTLVASKAYHARERMSKSLVPYMENGLPDDASALIRLRVEEGMNFGIGIEDMARFELSLFFATVGNSAPGAFWLMAHIWQTPGLLERVRSDILAFLESVDPGHSPSDPLPFAFLTGLSKNVPLLRSVFEEMMRLHSVSNSVRQVLSDTVLQGGRSGERDYLVKKDAVILIPAVVLHSDADAFSDPEEFRADRFIKESSKPAELRPWGGGGTICPGRFFATAEECAIAAMFVLGFDMECVDDRGRKMEWQIPQGRQQSQATGILHPKNDVNVRLTPRQGWNLSVESD